MELENERVCMCCMNRQIENEKHFLLDCEAYNDIRKELFSNITLQTEGKWKLGKLIPMMQWKVLMRGTKDKFQNKVAENVLSFVAQAMKRRNQI